MKKILAILLVVGAAYSSSSSATEPCAGNLLVPTVSYPIPHGVVPHFGPWRAPLRHPMWGPVWGRPWGRPMWARPGFVPAYRLPTWTAEDDDYWSEKNKHARQVRDFLSRQW